MSENDSQTMEKYKEIDLRELINFLLKKKRFIVGLALVAGVAVVAIEFFMPKTRQVNAAIEIGSQINQCGVIGASIVEAPLQVKEKIDRDIFGVQARANLGIGALPKITTINTSGTNILYLSIVSRDPGAAEKYLEEVCRLIVESHKRTSDNLKNFFDGRITEIQDEVAKLKSSSIPWQGASEGYYLQLPRLEEQVSCSELSLTSIKYTEVIRQPYIAEPAPLGLVAKSLLAAAIGLLVGIFIVLVAEWWRKA